MPAKRSLDSLRTWVEIDSKAARHNYKVFRKIVGPKTRLWSVVKSNAYGHGILIFSRLIEKLGVDGFCVDSLVEGLRLREIGIKKPILVLGMTLPSLFGQAADKNIAVTISNFEALKSILREKNRPDFHLKIDTGMHRQGFFPEDLPRAVHILNSSKLNSRLRGAYTHFASAKDINYQAYTEDQFKKFQKAVEFLKKSGFEDLISHCSATGATLVDKKYHLDAVRVGIGLYGLYPSKELEMQLPKVYLKPILSWRTIVGEVKTVNEGGYIGYDLVHRVVRPTKAAILPIGYWHGFPRSLSGIGEVLVNGKRSRVLGRVSMDLLAVDVTGIRCRPGDRVTLIGEDGNISIKAFDASRKSGTIHYEFLTRLNPLMERILV